MLIGVGIFVLALGAFLVWMLFSGGITDEERAIRELDKPVTSLPSGDPPPLAAAGRELYARNCQSCHGDRLSGGSAPALRARRYTPPRWEDQDLANVIYSGRGEMPGFKGKLSDGEIAALVAYLRWEQGVPFGASEAAGGASPPPSAAGPPGGGYQGGGSPAPP